MKSLLVFGTVAVLLSACNVYRPLTSAQSDEDYIEEAQRCLHSGDFGCASDNYAKVSNNLIKNEKLCIVNVARAGMTLNALLNVVNKGTDKMMGALANAVLPWSGDKSTAAALALQSCTDYLTLVDNTPSKKNGVLLKTLASMGSCALRMAKADQFQATSNSDTACNTPNPSSNGKVTADDVSKTLGAISPSNPGMCITDVNACKTELLSLGGGTLAGVGLNDLENAYQQLPNDIKTGVDDQVRNGLAATLQQ